MHTAQLLIVPLAQLRESPPIPRNRKRFGLLLAVAAILASTVASLVYVWLFCQFDLAPDEAHYWDWSRHLDWSYYSKGPLVAWLIRGSCELFGSLSLQLTGGLAAAVRLPAVVCHAATLTAWYVLTSSILRSNRLGLAVVLLASALPVVRIASIVMTIDPPFLACWCWALVCVWKALEKQRGVWWLGAGIFCGVGILAKYTVALFPAAVVAYLLFHRRSEFRRPQVWLMLMGTIVGCVPILLWNWQHDWVSLRHVFGQIGGGSSANFRWSGPAEFLAGQFGMLFGLWLCAFFAAAWRFRPRHENDPGVLLLWWCAVPVWGVFAVASFVKPGQANWPAPAYLSGFILSIAWAREQLAGPHRQFVAWCLGVNVLLGLAVTIGLHFPAPFRPLLAQLAGKPSERDPAPIRKVDITARLTGWKTLAAEVDRVRARVLGETGRDAVLAGTYWTIPGHLGFSCAGSPEVFTVGIPNRSDRHSQYDFWRPNPVADAQVFRGRTFVIVGDIGSHMLVAFERVENPIRVVHTENGIPMDAWTIWVCHGFRGFPDSGTHEPGY